MKKHLYLLFTLGIGIMLALSVSACNSNISETPETTPVKAKAESDKIASENFEILPAMDTVSNAKNQVWVGTFQLVWNDLIDELIKHPIKFNDTKADIIASNLNKKSFTTNDISESAYYKIWGPTSYELKKQIETGIKEKFNETSDILNQFDFAPEPDKYFLYAMLKKDFQYLYSFEKLKDDKFNGSEGNVKYFGIKTTSDDAVRDNITVLFYNNSNDFAVSIRSKGDDIIYLYRTDDEKTLDTLYSDMLIKSKKYTDDTELTKEDGFKAPIIEFKKERTFDELCNQPIQNSDFVISQAIETVQFNMSETGVKLKSEAAIAVEKMALPIQVNRKPRYFYFDNRYIIFLEEYGKKPYFAMKVEDAKALQE